MLAYVTRKKKNYMFGLEHSKNIFFSSNGYKGQNTFLYCILKMSLILRVLSDLSYPMSKICFEKGSSFEGASVVRVFHCFWVANNVHLIKSTRSKQEVAEAFVNCFSLWPRRFSWSWRAAVCHWWTTARRFCRCQSRTSSPPGKIGQVQMHSGKALGTKAT